MANNGPPRSPVSPIQTIPYSPVSTHDSDGITPASSPRSPQFATIPLNTNTVAQPTVPSPTEAGHDWIPFTLHWYFLLVPALASLSFSIVLAYLCWYSGKNYGVGHDNGSSAILFGWRFTPTLLAVLYTQTVVILFEDLKRTEPFARLAKAPFGGASAYGTVLQTPKAWWAILMDLTFRRKRVGKSSWALICSALIYMMALLAISPLSSALLTSEEITVPRTVQFNRLEPALGKQLPVEPTRDVFFRTVAGLTRKLSTSAWTSDTSLSLPFWPSTEKLQLTPDLVTTHTSWEAETRRLKYDLNCQNMTLERAELQNKKWIGYEWPYRVKRNGTTPMVSFVLTTVDKCKYELDMHPAVDIAYNGGIVWSNTTLFPSSYTTALNIEKSIFYANVSSEDPYARYRSSKECNDREIIMVTTPWTSPIERYDNEPFWGNETFTQSPTFRMRALLCRPGLYDTNKTITALMSPNSPTELQQTDTHDQNRGMPSHLVNHTRFQENFFDGFDWGQFIGTDAIRQDAPSSKDRNKTDYKRWTREQFLVRKRIPQEPLFMGMGAMLGPLSSWNVSSIIDDPLLLEKATRAKGRFLMEILRNSLSDPQLMQESTVTGKITVAETRVIVLREVGIALSVLFAVSFCLLIGVMWSSRPSLRPLNLLTDPGSTVGMGLLLDDRKTSMSILRKLHRAPRSEIVRSLENVTFRTSRSTLHEGNGTSASIAVTPAGISRKKSNWRPRVLRLRYLFALGAFLALVAAALLVLITFSSRAQLYQKAFVYQADLTKFGLNISAFAPISIAPTAISILISLWWDQIDMTFRLLQPYIAMSQSPSPVFSSSGLTYRSKTWIGAAVKAARHRHWILCFVAIGSVLSQVLTVSMSAMFERRSHNVLSHVKLNRTLETRQIPIILTMDKIQETEQVWWDDEESADVRGTLDQKMKHAVMDPLYQNTSYNWLYNTPTRLSLNASKLEWSQDAWSFAPVDLSPITSVDSNPNTKDAVRRGVTLPPMNVTVRTSAIRARLDCEPVKEITDQSTWLQPLSAQLLNETVRNKTNGKGIVPDDIYDGYILFDKMFPNTSSVTTVLNGGDATIKCCTNGTASDPHRAAIGYWSPVRTEGWNTSDPYPSHDGSRWPPSFITKWIVGKPRAFTSLSLPVVGPLYFKEPPAIQAARCKPVIETAEAEVLMDRATYTVHSHNLLGPIRSLDSAWYENYVRHDLSDSRNHYDMNYTGKLNVTTSLGIVFLESMFSAAMISRERGQERDGVYTWEFENTNGEQFVYREKELGLNMDLMTYAMYALTDSDPEALLNYTTLITTADRTFQSFFQDFIRIRLPNNTEETGFQSIGANTKGLGQAVDFNGTSLTNPLYTNLNTDDKIEATVSKRRQVLHMNPVATYLAIGIIIWLISTATIVAFLQRKYTSKMLRNVELIADVVVLIAGSDNFLELVRERGVSLKKDKSTMTKLGWFKGRDGEVRWGVEVVGGRNAVEWVEPPMKRF